MKPPFRLAVAASLLDGASRTATQIHALLKPEYDDERQATVPNIERHLQSLKAAGIVDVAAETLDADGILLQSYAISEYGRERVRKAS